jgi:hypothetical protein
MHGVTRPPPPVHLAPHGGDVAFRQRGEIIQPMVRVSERWDFRVFDTRRLHDLPLVRCGASLGV